LTRISRAEGGTELGTRPQVQSIRCPLCDDDCTTPWGEENGFACVRCVGCGFLYVNPRPVAESIDRGVQLGMHQGEQTSFNVVGSRMAWKVRVYKNVIRDLYPELQSSATPIRWLDVGAGFGELVEAIGDVAPTGSICEGIEPMIPKAEDARRRGLPIQTLYMQDVKHKYNIISLIDVFSHIPDFRSFLVDVKKLLLPGGEVFLKTGNAADLKNRGQFPGPLILPDHLTFGGERHVHRFLTEAGFEIVCTKAYKIDGLVYSLRNIARWILRRPVCLSLPYTSNARILYVRARLKAATQS